MAKSRPKKAHAKRKAPARLPAPRVAVKGGEALISLSVSAYGLEPILGAAYLMTDRAYSVLSGDKKKTLVVALTPKGKDTPAALGRAFTEELAAQVVRWKIARDNQPIREYVAEQAVLLANGSLQPAAPAEEPAADQLSDAQRLEIEKLIAEVEDEIKQMNEKKTVSDPKNIKASWEEKQGSPAPQESSS
jgi:His-Xaa-Ser system protein HxsD